MWGTHTEEDSHACSQCGKDFLFNSSLVVTLRIHKGEKPYQCSHCEKTISHNSHLKTHTRLHT